MDVLSVSYGGHKSSEGSEFTNYRSIEVDGYSNVLVADTENNRIVLLSPTLTYLGDIPVPRHQLRRRRPQALHLDHINHRLYIGDTTFDLFPSLVTGRVFVLG